MWRPGFIAVAAGLAVALAAPASSDTLDEAYAAYDRGDYRTALDLFGGLAEDGDADASFMLGLIHVDGKHAPPDWAAAVIWLGKAADLGHPDAQSTLGYAYDYALGVPLDPTQARYWYEQAVAGGSIAGMNNLAYALTVAGENLERALTLMADVLAVYPGDAAYLDTYGWIFFRHGRYADSLQPLCEAAALEPGNPEIAVHLGDALWRAGFADPARRQWRHALYLQDNPRALSENGGHYMGIQEPSRWRGDVEARLGGGLGPATGAVGTLAETAPGCSVPIS